MRFIRRRLLPLLLALCLTLLCLPTPRASAESDADLTLLFTSDLHSNVVPHNEWIDGKGARVGGFAYLKTAMDANTVEGRTLLLDSGDFTMGTLYQNYSVSDALELTLMDAIGYDAVALGNHDFELGEDGLAQMLDTFHAKGGAARILCGNLRREGLSGNALQDHGVADYAVIERGGLRVGVFAVMGKDAIQYTPVESLYFEDTVAGVRATVKLLRETEKVDLVVLLSHSGIKPDGTYAEDADIARAVDGIDVILSGHMHKETPEPIYANDTVIVCAGTALNYLGKLEMTRADGEWTSAFELIPLTGAWTPDAEIEAMIAPYTEKINREYLRAYGAEADIDAVVAHSPYDFDSGDMIQEKLDNYAFGALITDAYLYAARAAGATNAQIAAVPSGTIRGGLYAGGIQLMDICNALGYGASPLDGSCVSPMITACLTGRELYDMCETSVSLSPMASAAQILFGGLRYAYSDLRPLLNKVYLVEVWNAETGAYETVSRNEDTLYTVVCSWAAMKSISLVRAKSYGLIGIEPKDETASPLDTDEKLEARILRIENGAEMKEWYALYQYIGQMASGDDGLPVVEEAYGHDASFMTKTPASLATFFTRPNKAAWIQYGVALLALAILLTPVALVRRHLRRKRAKA